MTHSGFHPAYWNLLQLIVIINLVVLHVEAVLLVRLLGRSLVLDFCWSWPSLFPEANSVTVYCWNAFPSKRNSAKLE